MTDTEAINILKEATEPQVQGRITRAGYALIEAALAHVEARLAEKAKE